MKALVFALILFRFRFIPRVAAGLGVITTVLSTAGVTATLVGIPFSYLIIAPAGLVQFAIMLWLIWKGFSEPVMPTVGRA